MAVCDLQPLYLKRDIALISCVCQWRCVQALASSVFNVQDRNLRCAFNPAKGVTSFLSANWPNIGLKFMNISLFSFKQLWWFGKQTFSPHLERKKEIACRIYTCCSGQWFLHYCSFLCRRTPVDSIRCSSIKCCQVPMLQSCWMATCVGTTQLLDFFLMEAGSILMVIHITSFTPTLPHTHTHVYIHAQRYMHTCMRVCTQKNKNICQVVFAHFDILRFSRRLISPSSFRRVTWAFGFSDAFQRILNSMFCMIHMGFYVRVCIRWHFFSCDISSEFVQKCVWLGKFAMLIFTILTLFQLVKLGKNTRHMFLNLVGVFH